MLLSWKIRDNGVFLYERDINSCNYYDNTSFNFLHDRRVVRASEQTAEKNSFNFFLAGALHGYNGYGFDGADCRAADVLR